jgi:hypothetical protein
MNVRVRSATFLAVRKAGVVHDHIDTICGTKWSATVVAGAK